MLMLSDLLIAHKDVDGFPALLELVQAAARRGEMHFRINVKPPFPDTPDDWEDRLEAAFSGRV
ncbi:MAG: sulfur relay protein DsrC [Chromatiales bacterium]|nr:sulfur relay protein DsrC [Chromatiales bacterium]